jgi:hypothetical protein
MQFYTIRFDNKKKSECRKPGYRPKNSKNNVYTLKMTLKFLTIDEFKLYQPATNHIEPSIP